MARSALTWHPKSRRTHDGGARCEQRLHVGQSPGSAVDTSQRWQCMSASNLKHENNGAEPECYATLGRCARRGEARATESPLSTEASGGNAASFNTEHVEQFHRALCCVEQARDGGAKCEQRLHVAQSHGCAVDTSPRWRCMSASNMKHEKRRGVRECCAAVSRCARRRGSARTQNARGTESRLYCGSTEVSLAGSNAAAVNTKHVVQ